MSDAWQILGLSAEEADEKKVRSAYARLLKLARPDQNPEGFQRLRQAYEFALNWLRQSTAGKGQENPPFNAASSSPAASPTSSQRDRKDRRDWPRAWSFSLTALSIALGKMEHAGFQSDMGLKSALDALTMDAWEHSMPASALVETIEEAFENHLDVFASTVPDALLLRLLLDPEGGPLVRRVLAFWQIGTNSPRIAALANTLSTRGDGCIHERNADIHFRIAKAVAFHRPTLARELEEKMRDHLDPRTHAADFDQLTRLITRGLMFWSLPAELRMFWGERFHTPQPCEWRSPIAQQAVADAIARGPAWSGFETARELVPSDIWETAWKQRWRRKLTRGLARVFQVLWTPSTLMACLAVGLLVSGFRSFTKIRNLHNTPVINRARDESKARPKAPPPSHQNKPTPSAPPPANNRQQQ